MHVAADGALQWPGLADSRAGPAMRRLFVDARGNVWTGNDRSGLVRISPRLIQAVGRAEGLQDTLITSVTEATNGEVWVGTAGGSVARWNAGTWTNFALPGGTNAELSLVTADRHGRVWVSIHGNGLFVEEAGAFRRVLSRRQLEPGPRLLLADRADRLWLASYAGLFCYASNQLHKVLPAASNSDYAGAIAEGVDGAIWLGTFGGKLVCWRDGRLAEYFHRPPGRYVRFNSLSVDPDGTVWIGTLGAGLLHFRAGRFTPITTAQGLPANTIWQLQDDGLGHLWLGTRLGVVRVSKADLAACARGEVEQVPSRIFGRDDGLPTSVSTMEFHPNSWRGRDGRLWFATGNGVASLDPQAVRENAQPPPVLIEGVTVNGESRPLGGVGPGEGAVERALRVGPGRTTLEFHYTGLSLSAPERMRFAYQLEGLDSAWADAGGQRSAAYRYVPPGDYVFRVKACNSDGVWNEQGAALTVKVVPHFWQTGWFLAGAGLTTLAAVAMGVRAATRRRMQRRLQSLERLRELERERARIAQDLHDDLGAGLTEIGLTSELVQDATLPAEESREYAREIGGRARELVVALDEIVWAVNPRNDSLPALAAYFSQFAQHLCKPAGLRCRLDIAPDLPPWPLAAEQRHNLFLAFKEAVNNVVRHAGAREVRLTIALAAQRLVVTLQDDGCGFRPGATPEGADGLGNMRTRLQRLGGQCDIHSELGQGTRVCLDLPLKVPSV